VGSCGLCPVHQYYGRTLCRQPEGSAWEAGEPCPPVPSGTLGNGGVHLKLMWGHCLALQPVSELEAQLAPLQAPSSYRGLPASRLRWNSFKQVRAHAFLGHQGCCRRFILPPACWVAEQVTADGSGGAAIDVFIPREHSSTSRSTVSARSCQAGVRSSSGSTRCAAAATCPSARRLGPSW
jgi:hypothetical protein